MEEGAPAKIYFGRAVPDVQGRSPDPVLWPDGALPRTQALCLLADSGTRGPRLPDPALAAPAGGHGLLDGPVPWIAVQRPAAVCPLSALRGTPR